MIVIDVPWPLKELSPNWKGHWGRKARSVKQYRTMCCAYAHNAMIAARYKIKSAGALQFHLEFCPPNKQRRDDDNMVASFKAGRDGIADALGIDDSRFKTTFDVCDPVKGGTVRVTIQECAIDDLS